MALSTTRLQIMRERQLRR